jgi:hypothetical protein
MFRPVSLLTFSRAIGSNVTTTANRSCAWIPTFAALDQVDEIVNLQLQQLEIDVGAMESQRLLNGFFSLTEFFKFSLCYSQSKVSLCKVPISFNTTFGRSFHTLEVLELLITRRRVAPVSGDRGTQFTRLIVLLEGVLVLGGFEEFVTI